ncbi:MAG: transcriptional regulator, MarR family [Actinomycetia bacterium]|nr:transcriptional regulator, MarR family [Actinomycetes bacterium]
MQPDSVDRHVAHWLPRLPHLDPVIEGIVTRMSVLTRYLKSHRRADLAERGLKQWEYDVLHYLGAVGPPHRVAPSLLAEWLDMHPATLTSRLDRMEEAGYITRVHDPADRRRLLVAQTEKGHSVWRSAMNAVSGEEHAMVAVLSESERELLTGLLRRMVHAVEDDAKPLLPDWPNLGS